MSDILTIIQLFVYYTSFQVKVCLQRHLCAGNVRLLLQKCIHQKTTNVRRHSFLAAKHKRKRYRKTIEKERLQRVEFYYFSQQLHRNVERSVEMTELAYCLKIINIYHLFIVHIYKPYKS